MSTPRAAEAGKTLTVADYLILADDHLEKVFGLQMTSPPRHYIHIALKALEAASSESALTELRKEVSGWRSYYTNLVIPGKTSGLARRMAIEVCQGVIEEIDALKAKESKQE